MSNKERLRVTKIDYIPKISDKGAFRDPLKLIIVGVNDKGERRILKVAGTLPRIWVGEDPATKYISEDLKEYIVKIKKEGHSFVGNKPLWCIYLKYPYSNIVRGIRNLFKYHCQADVYYHEAVRSFYGIRAYIYVPERDTDIHISDIEPIENYSPDVPIRTNDYVLDIETGDIKGFASPENPTERVTCLTLLNKKTKEVHHLTTYKVEQDKIESILRSSERLGEVIEHTNDIPPYEGVIHLYQFYEGDPEENERDLFMCLNELQKKLGIVNIEEYTEYDIPYLTNRARTQNKYIKDWNDKNQGSRQYYPGKIFKYINEYDEEKLYKRFITKSAKASGRNALEWMAQEEMGYGKIKHESGFSETMEKDPSLLSAYNIWDCILPDRCLDKCGDLMNIRQVQCNYMAADLERWTSQMIMWESAIMYRLKCKKLLDSIDCVPKSGGQEAGGHVEGQPSGIYYNMIELDNSGEYNGVVMSCNISHEALLGPDEDPGDRPIATLPSGRRYYLDVEAIIPSMLIEMTKMIKVYKDKEKETKEKMNRLFDESGGVRTPDIEKLYEQLDLYGDLRYIYKSSSLSAIGLYGSGADEEDDNDDDEEKKKYKRPFRLAHGGMSSDVTEVGRYHEKWNKKWIQSHPFKWEKEDSGYKIIISENSDDNSCSMIVIYQDTDSCKTLIRGKLPVFDNDGDMRDFLTLVGNKYASALNDSFDEFAKDLLGIYHHNFSIKVDGVYKKYFQWGKKKLYVWKDFQNKVHYRGVKVRRRDIMPVLKAFMESFFELVMSDKDTEKTIEDISKLIEALEISVLSGKMAKECGEPKSVKKKTLMWDSMVYSNTVFAKTFRLGDVGIFYNIKAVVGHGSPKNKKVPLEWTDDPLAMGLKIDYDEVLRKIKQSMKNIIEGLEPGATWESIRDRHTKGNFANSEELW